MAGRSSAFCVVVWQQSTGQRQRESGSHELTEGSSWSTCAVDWGPGDIGAGRQPLEYLHRGEPHVWVPLHEANGFVNECWSLPLEILVHARV